MILTNGNKATLDSRVKKLSKLFSLKCNRNTISKLTSRNRISPYGARTILELYDFVEKNCPEADIQFELKAEYGQYVNEYGYNQALSFNILKRLYIDFIYLVYHYPDITVINSSRQTIDIKDVYVRVPINIGIGGTGRAFNYIEGTRTSLSRSQFRAGYFHSHLPARSYSAGRTSLAHENFLNYNTFCLGDGDLVSVTSLLNSERNISEDMLNLLIFSIKPFLEWESLEGSPHIHMSSATNRTFPNRQEPSESTIRTMNDYIRDAIKTGRVKPVLNWKFIDNHYEIIDDEVFETFLRDVMPANSNVFYYRDERGNYYLDSEVINSAQSTNNIEQAWIPFKGERKHFKWTEEIIMNTAVVRKKYLDPKIKTYVKRKLEYTANDHKVRQVGIEKLYSIDNS